MIPVIDPNTSPTILIWTSVDQCSWMLSLRSRMKLTPLCHSEEAAEKVFVDLVQWISMVDITWLVSAQSTKLTLISQLSHLSCLCLSWRILLLTCLTFTLNTNTLTPILSVRLPKNLVKENTSNLRRIVNSLMGFMNVSFVHAANLLAPHTGGTLKTILGLLSLCKLTDGLLIQEMNTLMKD